MKIAVIFNKYGPYHYARLNDLGKAVDTVGIELFGKSKEYAWTDDGIPTDLNFEKVTLFVADEISVSKQQMQQHLHKALSNASPDVVAINGWGEVPAYLALKWCGENKVPAVVMADSTEFDAPRNAFKELVKKQLVSRFSAALVAGKLHVDYIQQLGMPKSRIFTCYDVVDNDYFANNAALIRNNAEETRQKLGLPQNYFLASSRFVPKKNLELLLKGYAAYQKQSGPDAWHLVLLGDGEGRVRLEALIRELNITEYVQLPGFCQYSSLPSYYVLAKAFVHASTVEQWGLVVNEAMASGLPVILSKNVGCAPDLVSEGKNGWLFDPYSVEDLAVKLAQLAAAENELSTMGAESSKIIAGFSTRAFSTNMIAAAKAALQSRRRRSKMLSGVTLNFLINK